VWKGIGALLQWIAAATLMTVCSAYADAPGAVADQPNSHTNTSESQPNAGTSGKTPATGETKTQTDDLDLQEIIVTGRRGYQEQRKLDASFAVTSANSEQIAEKAPLSLADLISTVPGFFVESSGGEDANNVMVRAIPQNGNYRYLSLQEDGLPVYHESDLFFMSPDQLLRADISVKNIEAIRGGPAAIFATNAPGGIFNMITRRGTPQPEGQFKYEWGDYDHNRLDAYYSGPINDQTSFFVGGFYRVDNGIRDPGFNGNQGGQIHANITRTFDGGDITVYGKLLNDRNVFYLPIPLRNDSSGNPAGIAGFNPNFGTLNSLDAANVVIPTPDGDLRRDLRDGHLQDVKTIGLEFNYDLAEQTHLQAKARYMQSSQLLNAIFSTQSVQSATAYLESKFPEAQAAFPGATGVQYQYATSGTPVGDPATLNGNGLVTPAGWWTVNKPLRDFATDISVSRAFDLAGHHDLTGGFYLSSFSADEFWSFNDVLFEVRNQPRLLDIITVNAAGNKVGSVTDHGFLDYGGLYVNDSGQGLAHAFYFTDEWQLTDRLRADYGLRWDQLHMNGSVEGSQGFDLRTPNDNSLALQNVSWGNGRFTSFSRGFHALAWTVATNYSLTDQMGVFARFTKSHRLPRFSDFTFNPQANPATEDIDQAELGYKLASRQFSVFTNLFYSVFHNLAIQGITTDPATGATTFTNANAKVVTPGVEFEGVYRPVELFDFSLTATVQRPQLKDFVTGITVNNVILPEDLSGNQPLRTPKVYFTARPRLKLMNNRFQVYLNYEYIAKRFTDEANSEVLPSYFQLDAGADYSVTDHMQLSVHGTNLTNEIGLTEGNPRSGIIQSSQTGNIYLARPIFGRTVRVSATYRF
jgi:outer membrane receptor protein involved in Fe transport